MISTHGILRALRLASAGILIALSVFADDAKDTIEFFTIDAGAGHTKIEAAFKAGVMKSSIPKEMNVIEKSILFNDHLTPFGKWFWKHSYITMAKYAPPLWEFSYTVVPKITTAGMRRSNFSKFITPELIEALTKNNPKVIVCTQPVLAEIVDILKEQGKIGRNVKVVNLVTDYSVSEAYNTRGLIIVPDESLKAKLVKMGKDPSMIQVVKGIPAGPQFLEPFDKANVRAGLEDKLKTEFGKPVVIGKDNPFFVAAGGGEGLNLKEVVDFLPKWHPTRPVSIAIVCGKNEKLYKQLTELIASGKIDAKITVIPRGFIKNMFEYTQAADIVISKPGGSMTAEQMALGDGLFAHAYVPGQERHNYNHLTEKGVVQPLKLEELNDIDAILAKRQSMVEAIKREYPDLKELPIELAGIVEDYAKGKIPDSPKELAELDKRIARRGVAAVKPSVAGCAAAVGAYLKSAFARVHP